LANTAIRAAIAAIAEDARVAVRYPAAVQDPGKGDLISDAKVAEIVYTAFAGTTSARRVVRRVKDKNFDDGPLPWRYHSFFTNTALSTVESISPTGSTQSYNHTRLDQHERSTTDPSVD
jgi:hypothetical protein